MVFDCFAETFLRHKAGRHGRLARYWYEQDSGYPPDSKKCRQFWLGFGIDLINVDFSRLIASDLVQNWS